MIYRCPIDTCGRYLEPTDEGDPPTCAGAPMKEHDEVAAVRVDAEAIRAPTPDPRTVATGDATWDDVVAQARGLIVDGEAIDAADAVAQLLEGGLIDVGQADPLRMALAAEGAA